MGVRTPEELDALADVCKALAVERASKIKRTIIQPVDARKTDGTFVPAGTEVELAPWEGICESVNWLAAEVLEAIEGKPWTAIEGRCGYVPSDPELPGGITDSHIVLVRNVTAADDLDDQTLLADFCVRTTFGDEMPKAVRMLAGMEGRGLRFIPDGPVVGMWLHENRLNDLNLGPWLKEVTDEAVQQFKERMK